MKVVNRRAVWQRGDDAAGQRGDDAAGQRGGTATAKFRDALPAEAGESTLTLLVAFATNSGIALLKLAVGLLTGSAALLSEAAHSAGDGCKELLLLTALRRSDRPADRLHPFGYGKERYFWSLLAAGTVLAAAAVFSILQGLRVILAGPKEPSDDLWINYPVLAFALVLEGISFRQAIGHARGAARRGRRSVNSYIRDPQSPTVRTVVLEDSAALAGLLMAGAGVGLFQLTGWSGWDGLASVAIGALLMVAAFTLIQTCKGPLIGKQADLGLVRAIQARLEQQPEVLDLVDVQTMMIGMHRVLLCARVDFAAARTAEELESACIRIDADLRSEFPSLDEIFLQPVPRSDALLREQVLSRYGRVLADEPEA